MFLVIAGQPLHFVAQLVPQSRDLDKVEQTDAYVPGFSQKTLVSQEKYFEDHEREPQPASFRIGFSSAEINEISTRVECLHAPRTYSGQLKADEMCHGKARAQARPRSLIRQFF